VESSILICASGGQNIQPIVLHMWPCWETVSPCQSWTNKSWLLWTKWF